MNKTPPLLGWCVSSFLCERLQCISAGSMYDDVYRFYRTLSWSQSCSLIAPSHVFTVQIGHFTHALFGLNPRLVHSCCSDLFPNHCRSGWKNHSSFFYQASLCLAQPLCKSDPLLIRLSMPLFLFLLSLYKPLSFSVVYMPLL